MMHKPKDVLTTGDVARICNVAPRTVSKWFDSGQLRGYRIPGSRDRRIPVAQLVRFMEAHGIPLNGLDVGQVRLAIADPDEQYARFLADSLKKETPFQVHVASSVFEAGLVAGEQRPHVMVLEVTLPGLTPKQVCRVLREHEVLAGTQLVAIGTGLTEGHVQAVLQEGFRACLRKPFDIHQLIQLVDQLIATPKNTN